jgi:hypothetical protein
MGIDEEDYYNPTPLQNERKEDAPEQLQYIQPLMVTYPD